MLIYNITKKKQFLMHKINCFYNFKWIIRCIKTFGYYMEAYASCELAVSPFFARDLIDVVRE